MPTIKAAYRALRKSEKNAQRNKNILENIRYLVKQSEKAILQKNIEKARDVASKTIKAIDKAAQKKILKKNTAARKKSRLMQRIQSISG